MDHPERRRPITKKNIPVEGLPPHLRVSETQEFDPQTGELLRTERTIWAEVKTQIFHSDLTRTLWHYVDPNLGVVRSDQGRSLGMGLYLEELNLARGALNLNSLTQPELDAARSAAGLLPNNG